MRISAPSSGTGRTQHPETALPFGCQMDDVGGGPGPPSVSHTVPLFSGLHQSGTFLWGQPVAGKTPAPPVCKEGCSAQQGEPGATRRVPTPPLLRGPRVAVGSPQERSLSRNFWLLL